MVIVKIQDLPRVGGSSNGSKYVRVCESSEITYLNETEYEITFIDGIGYEKYGYHCKGWGCSSSQTIIHGSGSDTECGVGYGLFNPRNLIRFPSGNGLYYDTPCENYENAYRVNKPSQEGYVIGCPNGLEPYIASISTNLLTSSSLPSTSTLATSIPITSVSITSTPVIESTSSKSLMAYATNVASEYGLLSSFSSSPLLQTTPSSSLAEKSSASDAPWPTNAPTSESSEGVYASMQTSESAPLTSQEPQQSNEIIDLSKTSTQLGAGAIVGIVFASIAGFTILTVLIGIAGFALLNLASKGPAQAYSFTKTTRVAKV